MTLRLFTSESVTGGHPDKMADQISDAILDAILDQDPHARVAVETLLTTGQVHIAGELTTTAWVDFTAIARETILRIGYDSSDKGFDGNTCAVNVAIGAQSPDIAQGVNFAEDDEGDQGAGDQGMMFGYASNETDDFMPMPITIAHALAERLTAARNNGDIPYLRPDGKTQVTIGYDGDEPRTIDTVVVSSQHEDDVTLNQLRDDILQYVIDPVVTAYAERYQLDIDDLKLLINPTGRFVIGGPMGDAGLTGRKIIVDTYGGMARHGGGAFSGKDPSKVDRSGAYAMRWVAKTVVEAGLADRCEVQVAYAIGRAAPVGLYVDTFGTGQDARIQRAIEATFDLRPSAIIRELGLTDFDRYRFMAAYGHMGRLEAPWENTFKLHELIENYYGADDES